MRAAENWAALILAIVFGPIVIYLIVVLYWLLIEDAVKSWREWRQGRKQ